MTTETELYIVTGTRTIDDQQHSFEMPVRAADPEEAVHLFLNEVIMDPDEFNMVGVKN